MLLVLRYQVLVDYSLKHSMKIENVEKKITNTSGLVKKITEIERKIPNVTALVTTEIENV